MKKIIPFNYHDFSVRVIFIDDEPWFVAKDVAEVLGYVRKDDRIDTNGMVRRLYNDDTKELKRDDFNSSRLFGNQGSISIISEAGLYMSIFGSKKKEAEEFKKWVTREVLPSIRKTGSYSIEKKTEVEKLTPEKSLEIVEKGTQLLTKFRDLNPVEQIKLDTFHKNESGESLLEKFGIHFKNSYFLPTELGNFSGISGAEINLILEKKGLQFKDENGIWKPTSSGKEFCLEIGNKFNQLKWKIETIF
jgi:prophage antirepressor-like protein